MSQRRNEVSSLPEASTVLLSFMAKHHTTLLCPVNTIGSGLEGTCIVVDATFHSWTVVSCDPEANKLQSLDSDKHFTPALCPEYA